MKAEEEVRQEGSMGQNLISGRLCVGLSECDPTDNTKSFMKKWKAPFMTTEVHQAEYFTVSAHPELHTSKILNFLIHPEKIGAYQKTWRRATF